MNREMDTLSPHVNGDQDLSSRAKSLIRRATFGYNEQYGFGSMSCAAYDTAWVSMIVKEVDGKRNWLFPQCFRYLLNTQRDDGSWSQDGPSQIDEILNTAASLLSLKRHAADPSDVEVGSDELSERIYKAATALEHRLTAWCVSTTDHVGFEIILPRLLDLLEKEDSSLKFDFEGRGTLESIHAEKLSRFKPEHLYGKKKTTALHSVEAFIGLIDFDKISHHKVQGSMMGSPSATAAYLMNASQWDSESEEYLEHVVNSGQGDGGVPSAYPSTYFEYSWILSTLAKGGFAPSDLECPQLFKMTDILARALKSEGGIIGFAPHIGADVDDTSKAILALRMLGQSDDIGPEQMIEHFEADTHFLTYPSERDPSVSANCNVLFALLHEPNPSQYSAPILKITRFLCDTWWNTDGWIKDKWNLQCLYPTVLLVEALADLFVLIEEGALSGFDDDSLLPRISIVFFQACLRTLLEQSEDGSWDQSVEHTAHGIQILCKARQSNLFSLMREQLDSAVDRGVVFILSLDAWPADYVWIEKVSYASPLLTEAYVLAALKSSTSVAVGRPMGSHFWFSMLSTAQHAKLFQTTPLFSSVPELEIHLSLLEATLFQPLLRSQRLFVFPRSGMEEDRYFDIIPFTWTACNNRARTFASTSFIYEMMIISFLNYQADEFMEAVAGPSFVKKLPELRELIESTIANVHTNANGNGNGVLKQYSKSDEEKKTNAFVDQKISLPLARFVGHVLQHPSVTSASPWSRDALKRELGIFLKAHVTQTEDNQRFRHDVEQHKGVYRSATDSFFRWVCTTSADHTSCPYAFAFVNCLLSTSLANGEDCFTTAHEKYLSAAVCRHLASMCRMYNDYGSVTRDEDEMNLNSVNFPEFFEPGVEDATGGAARGQERKEALFRIAEYERSCLDVALGRLETEGGLSSKRGPDSRRLYQRRMEIWRMFCDVTDLYGQLYVVRDLASRMTDVEK